MSVHRSKTRGPGLPAEATLFLQAQRGNRTALNGIGYMVVPTGREPVGLFYNGTLLCRTPSR